MNEILVSLTNVSRHYGRGRSETAALTGVSCQIAANDRVAVV
jgi:ABC-type lipoprotein export system ATPase subunit